jgi:hypothetical protein
MTRRLSLFVALLAATATAPASAELVVVDGTVQMRPATLETPRRGMRMADVEARFGAPESRNPAVGDPPISRWQYAGFTVYFEGDIVLHSVVRGG